MIGDRLVMAVRESRLACRSLQYLPLKGPLKGGGRSPTRGPKARAEATGWGSKHLARGHDPHPARKCAPTSPFQGEACPRASDHAAARGPGVEQAAWPNEAGFTLVEVIAAFAILALAFSILLATISDGIRRTAQAETEADAASLAQALLALAGTEAPLRGEERAGQDDKGLRWRLRAEPYVEAGEPPQGRIGAYRVTAEVFWRDGREERWVALSTLRVGEPAR
jgi:general secretion pathway protein I